MPLTMPLPGYHRTLSMEKTFLMSVSLAHTFQIPCLTDHASRKPVNFGTFTTVGVPDSLEKAD